MYGLIWKIGKTKLITESAAIASGMPNANWQHIDLEEATTQMLMCAGDFIYFVNTFVYLQDKEEQDWERFILWYEQERAANAFFNERKVIVLKARQLGLSWLAVSYAVWHMLFDPIAEILIFSKGEREAIDLLSRAKGIYQRLPNWMKCANTLVDQNTTWKLGNGSRIQVLPRTAGDSYAATLIIFDEADHVQDFSALYNRARPAIGKHGKMFIISTVNKDEPASLFKNLFMKAWDGVTDSVAVFLAYFSHPDRNEKWYDKTKSIYFEENGGYDEFYGHYPATPEDALKARVMNQFIPSAWLNRCYDDSLPRWIVGNDKYEENLDRMPPDIPPIPNLIIYAPPKQGVDYVIACDPAEGIKTQKRRSETAITIVEASSLTEVAHLSGRIDATTTGKYIHQLCIYYNESPTMIERNNHGHTVIAEVRRLGGIRVLRGFDRKHGWLTNIIGKPRMYDATQAAFRDWACVIRTQKTMIQLSTIERATLSAPDNMYDDCADSFALCIAAVVVRGIGGGWGGLLDLSD